MSAIAGEPITTGRTRLRVPSEHGVTWSRSVPEAWEQRLGQLVAPLGHPEAGASSLLLRWDAGEPWWPIERWVLWQVRSRETAALLYPDHLAELDGPNPRSQGHACFKGWCTCKRPREMWVRSDPQRPVCIDYWQWRLYHETGGTDGGLFGTRWLCVQGRQGGTRWDLTPVEAQMDRLKGGRGLRVMPGALPYADFDERTMAVIAKADRLRTMQAATDDLQALARELDREERSGLASAAGAYFDAQDEALSESASAVVRLSQQIGGELPVSLTTREDRIAAQRGLDRDTLKADMMDSFANS